MTVRARGAWVAAVLALVALCDVEPARAEVVEEIVAKVNDDIITKTDLEQAEQSMMAEVYRRFTGAELDEQIKRARGTLLRRLIDDKILLHRAQRLYDLDKMGKMILSSFKEQQQIQTDEDLERLLAQEGMTVADLQKRLLEMYAPDEVLRFEVGDRVSVSDKDVEAYYTAHPDEFRVPGEATVREIVLLAEGSRRDERRTEAERVRERATAPGADFAAIAREVSEAGTRDAGGLLGTVRRGDLAPALETVAFTMPIGDVSPVIEVPHGFHILRLEARSDDRLKTLDEVRESLRSRLADERYQDERKRFLDKAWDEATVVVSPAYRARLAPDRP